MAYEIKVDTERRNVQIAYYSPTNLEEIGQGRGEMLQACEEHKIHNILLDLSNMVVKASLSFTDCFFLADSWTQEKRPLGIFLACVMPKEKEAHDYVSFYITAAKNRGLFIEGFNDTYSAKQWLADK